MSDAPKLTLLQVAGIRANTEAFLKQHGDSTTVLMPMLPKRLLIMCDTIEQLYEEVESLTTQVSLLESEASCG